MEQSSFNKKLLQTISKVVYGILKKENILRGNKHFGVVTEIVSPYRLKVQINGSTVSQIIPCNPNINFVVGDNVFVEFINGNSNDKYVPYKRATGTEDTTGGSTGTGGGSSAIANISDAILRSNPDRGVMVQATPPKNGNYIAYLYLRVVNNCDITITLTYNDVTGSQTQTLMNGQFQYIGSYSIIPVYFNACTTSPISITATSSVDGGAYLSTSVISI